MKTAPLVTEQAFNAPAEKVWKAITDTYEMKQWYFNIKAFKPEVGFSFQFYAGNEEKQYLHICQVTEVIKNKKLSYSWKYEGYPGESFVTFELFPGENTTTLTLTHSELETFGTENPDLSRENFKEGWKYIIGTSLKKYVEGN